MISDHLQKAIDTLKIQDLYVHELTATCQTDFYPKYEPDIDKLTIQHMHLVRQSTVVEAEDKECILQVFVRMGVRWKDSSEENEELSIKATIEAEFIAEYSMANKLEQQAIDEFSLKNVSYHVWPYWRELLSSQCTRMHLPRLILPTMQLAQNREQAQSEKNDSEKQE